jgi:HSP20 family protein
MNLLENKKLLHRLLHQGDMLNTLNGGVVHTSVKQQRFEDKIEITATAPGLHPEQFQIVLNGNKLSVFTLVIPFSQDDIENEHAMFGVPMFYREIKLPAIVDKSQIKAEYEEGRLKIIAPFFDKSDIQRIINIRNKE